MEFLAAYNYKGGIPHEPSIMFVNRCYFIPPHMYITVNNTPRYGIVLFQQEPKFETHIWKPWLHYLHDLVIHKQTLVMLGHNFGYDWHDALMNKVCAENLHFAQCDCVSHENYLNLLNTTCNPRNHYYPSTSLIGTRNYHCDWLFQSLLMENKLVPARRDAYDTQWTCNNQHYNLIVDHNYEDSLIEYYYLPHIYWIWKAGIIICLMMWLKMQCFTWFIVKYNLFMRRDIFFGNKTNRRAIIG